MILEGDQTAGGEILPPAVWAWAIHILSFLVYSHVKCSYLKVIRGLMSQCMESKENKYLKHKCSVLAIIVIIQSILLIWVSCLFNSRKFSAFTISNCFSAFPLLHFSAPMRKSYGNSELSLLLANKFSYLFFKKFFIFFMLCCAMKWVIFPTIFQVINYLFSCV